LVTPQEACPVEPALRETFEKVGSDCGVTTSGLIRFTTLPSLGRGKAIINAYHFVISEYVQLYANLITCVRHKMCRYRVRLPLFARIADAVTQFDPFFQEKENAAGRLGCHPYQKVTACFRMLANGCSADSLDAELRMSASLVLMSLKRFVRAVIKVFGPRYLRSPTERDLELLLQEGHRRGFPGMLGSLDCMHWEWKNCPYV